MKAKFNLTKALNGHPLVTRNGNTIKNFKPTISKHSDYEYTANMNGYNEFYYTSDGKYLPNTNHRYDLLLKVNLIEYILIKLRII